MSQSSNCSVYNSQCFWESLGEGKPVLTALGSAVLRCEDELQVYPGSQFFLRHPRNVLGCLGSPCPQLWLTQSGQAVCRGNPEGHLVCFSSLGDKTIPFITWQPVLKTKFIVCLPPPFFFWWESRVGPATSFWLKCSCILDIFYCIETSPLELIFRHITFCPHLQGFC